MNVGKLKYGLERKGRRMYGFRGISLGEVKNEAKE